ncbi:HalOD1 output domain-containing protein [Halorarius litoreus]|uniref:HalOD1 output domain-containing protein n=1 Tax=Halorarius litoreus TaxID=2962676 RepID=UPI0020CD4768|nr:HalOD1 output domain-containing protein [Halorarius litoreus]
MAGDDAAEAATMTDVIDEVLQVDSNEVVYVAHHDVSENGLTVTVSLALAAVTDHEPATLVPEFSKHVDPDALDRMFRPLPNGDLRKGGPLHLHIAGHDVEIHNTGRIEIYD